MFFRKSSLLGYVSFFPVSLLAVPEKFTIHDFAGPPNIEYPTGISAAANGDVYVSVDKNGSLGHEKDYGKIAIARDTDGDGKADKFIDYVPVIDSPRGGHFAGGTFYVIHPPYLTSFRDTDGDDVADERKLLVEGFGWGIEHPRGADHTTNGVRMGIDGWLYVGVGDFGMPDAKGADGTRYTLFGGGVVRVRPDGSEMEPYALMTRNHFAPAISPYLDMFVRDNTNDGKGWNTRFHHFTAMGDYGYPRLYQNFEDETIKPLADYGGGSGTGAVYIHEPGFPEKYGDTVYTCDWTTGNVHIHPLKPFEATFIAEQETFHQLPRAIDVDVDGFSRIYLADWRNGGFKYGGPDLKVGMVQQVTFPAIKPASYVDVTKVADTDLAALILSPSAVQRMEAQREILRREKKRPIFAKGVIDIAKDEKAPLYSRVAAIFTFKQLYGKVSTKYLAPLAADAPIREFILRAMADRLSELEGVPLEPYLAGLNDPNPRVRLQASIGVGRLKAQSAAPALLAAAATWPTDESNLEKGAQYRLPLTAVKALARIGNVKACLDALTEPTQRRIALSALQEIHGMDAADGLITIADATPDAALRESIIGALARLYHVEKPWDLKFWWQTRPDDRGPYFEPIAWEGTPKIREAIERNFSKLPNDRHDSILEILAKNRINFAEIKLGDLDPVIIAMKAKSLDAGQLQVVLDAARDAKSPWERRLECYRALSKAPADQVTTSRLTVLANWSALPDAPAAAQAITDFVNETQRGTEVQMLRKLAAKQNDPVSRIAWKALLTVRQSPLADAKAKQQVDAAIAENPREVGFFQAIADLGLSGFEQQIAIGMNSDNEQLIAVATAARDAGAKQSATGKKVAELTNAEVLKHAMSNKGDLKLGERIYTAQGCIACHSVDPAAEQKGPYLGSAGAKFTRDYLIESITEPDKVIAQGFRSAIFQMNDGSAKMGFVTGEADGVVSLRDIAGQASQIRRADVKSQQELPNSMMPPGLGANLTLEEFTSLIDYLVSLKAVGG